MIQKMRWCDKCNSVYEEGSQSPCALGTCAVNLRLAQHEPGVVVSPGITPSYKSSPDALLLLITNLSSRLENVENNYKLLEQGMSGQEIETRRLRDHVSQQWEQVDRLRNLAEPVAKDASEGKQEEPCNYYRPDYEAIAKSYSRSMDIAGDAAAEYHAAWQDAVGSVAKDEAEDKSLYGTAVMACAKKDQEIESAWEAASDYHTAWEEMRRLRDEWECVAGRLSVRTGGTKTTLAIDEAWEAAVEYQVAWEDSKWQSEYWKRLAEALGAEGGVR